MKDRGPQNSTPPPAASSETSEGGGGAHIIAFLSTLTYGVTDSRRK
ncbi:MAG: hypothetical protein GY820_00655 [Gammaproteobacteria bacterium]|nr:hypothetical protein [Gammaproteobacteria bacterium]